MSLKGLMKAALVTGVGALLMSCTPGPDTSNIDLSSLPIHVKGNENASVVLVEYSDLQCPACQSAAPFVKQIVSELGNKIRFEYRHFPLKSIHRHAEAAALAAEAAGYQGKFWEMHDKLFAEQASWSVEPNPNALFESYAKELGLDIDQFKADKESAKAKATIERDSSMGTAIGVNSTPSFYLNGVRLQPNNYEEFKNMIREASGS